MAIVNGSLLEVVFEFVNRRVHPDQSVTIEPIPLHQVAELWVEIIPRGMQPVEDSTLEVTEPEAGIARWKGKIEHAGVYKMFGYVRLAGETQPYISLPVTFPVIRK